MRIVGRALTAQDNEADHAPWVRDECRRRNAADAASERERRDGAATAAASTAQPAAAAARTTALGDALLDAYQGVPAKT